MTRTKAYKRAGKLLQPARLQPKEKAVVESLETLDVDQGQCAKAVKALVAHLEKSKAAKEETELITNEDHLYLVITLKQMSGRDQIKPVRLALPNPLIDPKKSPVCLFTKDPQRQYKDLLETKNISFISRVVGVDKLKGKFKPFEARRQLMAEYDLFLADDRVIPLLPKLLGRNWIEAKKQPLPICIKRTDLKAELEKVISSTSLLLGRGSCTSVKVGTPLEQHTEAELLENLLAIIPQVAAKLPLGGWKNVQALHVKTSTSASLPIWNCNMQGRFDVERRETNAEKRASLQEAMATGLADEDDEEVLEPSGAVSKGPISDDVKKSKKRAAEPTTTIEEKKQAAKKRRKST